MARLRITASPFGKRVGLALGGDGTDAVSVVVLPKLWRQSAPPEPTWPLQLVLYETEKVDVECTPAQQELLLSLDTAANAKRDDTDALLAVQVLGSKAGALPKPESPEGDGTPADLASRDPSEALVSLLSLTLLAHKCATAARPLAAANQGAAGMLVSASRDRQEHHALLLLLQQWQFVEELERRQREIRRGYVPVTETLGAVRGRITPHGLVRHLATGAPILECTHDEFTDATPLFRVLVTALELVASGCAVANLGKLGEGLAPAVTRRAMTLRRALAAIPSLPVPLALHFSTVIRLNRLQARWTVALDFARSILHVNPPTLAPPEEGGCAAWWIDSDKLWEAVLESALCRAQPAVDGLEAQRGRKGASYGPWRGLGTSKRPDLRVQVGEKAWVVDAKYKPDRPTPEPADQYQIFSYAILADGDTRLPTDVALITPHRSVVPGAEPQAFLRKRRSKGKSSNDLGPARFAMSEIHGNGAPRGVHLHLLGASFPAPTDLRGATETEFWLGKAGNALRACLDDPTARPDEVGAPEDAEKVEDDEDNEAAR